MIYNTTYEKKEITEEINGLVGAPFSFLQRVRKGGIGSEKMMVIDSSPLIEGLLQYDNQPNYCYMELRPRGIIVRFMFRSEQYSWIIPFGKLSLTGSKGSYRIYGDADFVKVNKAFNGSALIKFMDRIMAERLAYLQSVSGPDAPW